MSKLVARRQRIARVRGAQHALAVAESVRTQEEANAIAHNAERLRRVRGELFRAPPVSTGASFAAYRELADRLERAGRQLDGALYDAQRRVDEAQSVRIETNRDKEIAERLKERAKAVVEEQREARLAALPRYRTMQMRGDQS